MVAHVCPQVNNHTDRYVVQANNIVYYILYSTKLLTHVFYMVYERHSLPSVPFQPDQ